MRLAGINTGKKEKNNEKDHQECAPAHREQNTLVDKRCSGLRKKTCTRQVRLSHCSIVKIIVIGDRACGKTSLGKALAERLGWPFFDVDEGIHASSGMTNVEIWVNHGEPELRRIEHGVCEAMCGHDPAVISFSAGATVQPRNFRFLEEDNTFVVYINAGIDLLWDRLQSDPQTKDRRPQQSTGGIEEVIELYNKRHPIYGRFAHSTLDAGLSLDTMVDRVMAELDTGKP